MSFSTDSSIPSVLFNMHSSVCSQLACAVTVCSSLPALRPHHHSGSGPFHLPYSPLFWLPLHSLCVSFRELSTWIENLYSSLVYSKILPPLPLTSCLSFTSCLLCPSVSFAISNFISLPVLLLCLSTLPCSCSLCLILLLFTPPHSLWFSASPFPPFCPSFANEILFLSNALWFLPSLLSSLPLSPSSPSLF